MSMESRFSDSDTEKQERLRLREEFLIAFYRLIKTVTLHNENNQTAIDCAEQFARTSAALGKEEEYVSLKCLQGKLYLQNERMVYRREMASFLDSLYAYLEKRECRELRIYIGVTAASVKQVLSFARLIHQAIHMETPSRWLVWQLKAQGLAWAAVLDEAGDDRTPDEDLKVRAKKAYASTLAAVREVARKVADHHRAGIVKTLRMSQGMVDLMMLDESVFMLLSTIRDYDDYTFSHSVNVAVLSLCMGKRIGLSKKSLERLALCGLLHDIGKIEVPKTILNKPGKLTDDELIEMQRHAINSARLIVRLRTTRDRKARLLLPPFEHHLKYDLSGYPKTSYKRPVSLFGRILTIADVYDAVTSPRVYRSSVLSPDQALGLIFKGAGKDFDPILTKVFVNMMGVYPVGTLVVLETGEMGLVTRSKDPVGMHPVVLSLVSDGKGGYLKGRMIDLSVRDEASGRYRYTIRSAHHPGEFGIHPAVFCL